MLRSSIASNMVLIDVTEDVLRAEFERQHAGRNLLRHRLRGTYSSGPIAALWNQHVRTARFMAERYAAINAAPLP